MRRTPEQIIGKDALLQLIFEGYVVVPATGPCQECGMRLNEPFVGTPVCLRYAPDGYSNERKSELMERGCFTFRINS